MAVPGHTNWEIETAVWNLAGFFHFFYKPAGSDLGSFLIMINRNFSNIKSLKRAKNLIKNRNKISRKSQHLLKNPT